MPLFSILAGLASAYAGAQSARKQNAEANRQRKERARRLAQALGFLSPEGIAANTGKLSALFRQQIAGQGAPQTRQDIYRYLGQSGVGDSNVGSLLANAAERAPELGAFNAALQSAQSLGGQSAQIAAGSAPEYTATSNSLMDILSRGALTGAEGYSLFGNEPVRTR